MSSLPSDIPRRFTYADYLAWPDEECWELIEGVPYAMTPAPGTMHQAVSFEMAAQLRNGLRGGPCRGFTAPIDVRLPEGGEADSQVETVVQPDLLVVCDPKKIDERGIRGAPDFIVEIASPRTAVRDEIIKTRLYEKHGVREYWILRPEERLLSIRRLGADGRYGAPHFVEARGRVRVAVLEEFEFDWEEVYGQLPGGF